MGFIARALHLNESQISMGFTRRLIGVLEAVMKYSYQIAIRVENGPIDTILLTVIFLNTMIKIDINI